MPLGYFFDKPPGFAPPCVTVLERIAIETKAAKM
jgi:hypothetical protein